MIFGAVPIRKAKGGILAHSIPLKDRRLRKGITLGDEDIENLAPIQNSMESQFYEGLPLSYQERRIYYLHETIDRTIGIDHIPENLRVSQLLSPFIESV